MIVLSFFSSTTGMKPTENERIAPSLTNSRVSSPSLVLLIFALIQRPSSLSSIRFTFPMTSLWSLNSFTCELRSTEPLENCSLSPPPISITSSYGTALPMTSLVSVSVSLISKLLFSMFISIYPHFN